MYPEVDSTTTVDTDLELLKKDFGLDPKEELSLAPVEQKENATVELACEPLSAALQAELQDVFKKMRLVIQDIDAKAEIAQAKEASLQKKLDAFIKAEIFTGDARKKALTNGVESYLGLLAHIRSEMDKDLQMYAAYVGEQVPATVSVPASAGIQDSAAFFKAVIAGFKTQAKDVQKYLMVSHSRYMYGFDLQEKSLDALSYKLLSLQIQQRAKAAQASAQ